MTENNSNIVEIFSSVQGEGSYIGYRQLFIRFALCNLNCLYCDTGFEPQEYCKIEEYPGSGTFKDVKNPINVNQLVQEVLELNCFNHHSLSLTGGEPLLCADFLNYFLFELKKVSNLRIYLETNGTLPEELRKIIDKIDIISMDFKIESSYGKPAMWKEHREFIQIARENGKEIFSKIVVTNKITGDEIDRIANLAGSFDKPVPVILQPVSSNDKKLVPDSAKLLNIQEKLLKKLEDVRIIPQVHKYLKML